jgi:hypothetical protein
MTELNLSDRPAPQESGIGGRFLVDWKTIAGLIITAFLAYSAIDRRVALVEAKYDSIQQQLLELRSDVKELLRRQP